MKKIIFSIITIGTFFICAPTIAEKSVLDRITDNIIKVCDKPENAGKYWDIKVRGNGKAELKLKLAELGITGGAEFSKGEWQGVKSTVENNVNYRDCVKELTPIFVEKFTPILNVKNKKKLEPKILGGVKWMEFGLGIEMTLDKCKRHSTSVFCTFFANATNDDASLKIYGGSAIYDQNGHKFLSNFTTIANFKSALKKENSYLTGEIVKGVDTEVTIRFPEVSENSTIISKAMIKTYIKSKGINEYYNFEFRDIKIGI